MFAGVGGFREGLTLASENSEFTCVGHCEIDAHANKSYNTLFDTKGRRFCSDEVGTKCKPRGGLQDRVLFCETNDARSATKEFFCEDARRIDPAALPDFDLLCGGFPCQAFSVAGSRGGFADPRGTLFFELARLAEARHPAYLLFENVPGLLSHDGGKTFAAILHALDKLGYYVEWQVLNSADFGVPQARKRLYLIGTLDARCRGKVFPILQAAGALATQTVPGRQGEHVYSAEGASCTLTAQCGGFGGKTGLYEVGIPIKENTKKGYKLALPGDSIDIAYAGLNSRRGRVGKQCAHTLTTASSQATLHFIDLNPDPTVTEISRCLTTRQNNSLHTHRGECSGVFVVDGDANAPGTICMTAPDGTVRYGRIRRLTPRECLRLQGWQDERIDLILPLHSDNRLYKQAGNGVTVTVVEAIGRRIAAMHAELHGEAIKATATRGEARLT
ncbi:MAG: DNA (cytosine-5-)-methyltransferase [Ruthenibacterium sp.]